MKVTYFPGSPFCTVSGFPRMYLAFEVNGRWQTFESLFLGGVYQSACIIVQDTYIIPTLPHNPIYLSADRQPGDRA